jgi:hypothetical protein
MKLRYNLFVLLFKVLDVPVVSCVKIAQFLHLVLLFVATGGFQILNFILAVLFLLF